MVNKRQNKSDKQKSSKKPSSGNNSSDQKENRHKKMKKSDPNDSIDMSKQLLQKKSTQSCCSKRSRTNNKRVCPNGLIMPSLADLEKMYEDSDSDDDNKSEKITPQTIIDVDSVFSPSTRANITEQVTNLLSKKSQNNSTLQSPLRKRFRCNDSNPNTQSFVEIIESDTATTVNSNMIIGPICISNENVIKDAESEASIPINSKDHAETQQNKNKNATPAKNIEKYICDDDSSDTDSNKTINYQLVKSTSQSEKHPRSFFPLPSTSKDDSTFIKNDELYIASLEEATKETKDPILDATEDVQIIETPIETIVIDDEVNIEQPPITIKADLERTESTNIGRETIDDDCVFIVETQSNSAPSEPEVIQIIDHDINTISTPNNNNKNRSEKNKVIDVDALIAKNNSMIEKFKDDPKRFGSSNFVVDVDIVKLPIASNNTTNSAAQVSGQVIYSSIRGFSNTIPNVLQSNNPTRRVTSSTRAGTLSTLRNNPAMSIQIHENSPNNTRQNNQHSVRGRPGSLPHNTLDSTLVVYSTLPCLSNTIPNVSNELHSNNPNRKVTSSTSAGLISTLRNNPTMSIQIHENSPNNTGGNNQHSVRGRPGSLPHDTLDREHLISQGVTDFFNGLNQSESNQPNSAEFRRHLTQSPSTQPLPSSSNSVSRRLGNLGDCPICLDTLSGNAIASTICGHVFCLSCLERCVRANKRCPNCRKILKNNGYHQIFL